MLTALALSVAILGQRQTLNVPKINYEIPVSGGQREIILGPKLAESAQLNGTYEREIAAKHLATPDNTGGYVDSMIPGGTAEDNLGFFECSTRADNIFGKDCMLITSTARWNQKIGKKPHEIKFQTYSKQQWWVLADGTILRHYYMLQTPDGTQSADCTYGKDSIQRRYTDAAGQITFGEIFPSCGMEALHAQFKPMLVDGKVVLREKKYTVLNPLTGGLEDYVVYPAGTFKGEWLSATFKGKLFNIDGPKHTSEKVFIDDTGDLVKVNLSEEKYFVIVTLPKSHADEFGHPVRKSGGG
jgi:hypothetical protein